MDIVDADKLDLLGNSQPLLVYGTQHADGDGVGGNEQRPGPVAGQHLLRQLVARGTGEIPAIEILLLHHPQPLPVVEKRKLPQIGPIVLATDITDALMSARSTSTESNSPRERQSTNTSWAERE